MHKHNLVSIIVPIASILVFTAAFFLLKPQTTGLVVYTEDAIEQVNADVTLSTKEGEVLPLNAFIEVELDGSKDRMPASRFIQKTGLEYNLTFAEMPEIGFYGQGFTGDHIYRLNLSDFMLNRGIGKGEHVFIMRIIYREKVLFEKENRIMISE